MAGGPRMFSRPSDPQAFQNTLDDWENQLLARLDARLNLLGNAPASAPLLGSQPDGYQALRYGLFSPPDRQGFIATPRRRLFALANAVALPVGTTAVSQLLTLQDTLQLDDGLQIEYLGAQITVAPGAAAVITIKDVAIQLIVAGNTILLPLGTPTITTLTPTGSDTFQFAAQPLLAARDLDFFARLNGVAGGISAPGSQPLQLQFVVNYLDATAASTVTSRFFAMYRVVQGLTGA